MSTVILLAGGGIKSAVAAARIAGEHELVLVHVNYGQSAAAFQAKAIQSLMPTYPNARYVALSLPHLVELQRADDPAGRRPGVRSPGSEAAGRGPTRAEASSSSAVADPPASLPLRGLWTTLCAIGAQCAMRFGATEVVTGLIAAGSATHLGLPVTGVSTEVRREFLHALNVALEMLSPKGRPVRVEAPLIGLSYAEILRLAERFEVPLAHTWTCEQAGPQACGRCDSCRLRSGAFEQAMLMDPARPRHAKTVS